MFLGTAYHHATSMMYVNDSLQFLHLSEQTTSIAVLHGYLLVSHVQNDYSYVCIDSEVYNVILFLIHTNTMDALVTVSE